jgi:hypothetical protein
VACRRYGLGGFGSAGEGLTISGVSARLARWSGKRSC